MVKNKNTPILPKATAIWLIDNTTLTFKQIADFCDMHELEVQCIADGEVSYGINGLDPITNGQLTRNEIERCCKDPCASLELNFGISYEMLLYQSKSSKKKYTPIARRQDKPAAIYWLVKHYPELQDSQIIRLIGTTKITVNSIRDRSHWNIKNITPKDPVLLGLCTQLELDKTIENNYKTEIINLKS